MHVNINHIFSKRLQGPLPSNNIMTNRFLTAWLKTLSLNHSPYGKKIDYRDHWPFPAFSNNWLETVSLGIRIHLIFRPQNRNQFIYLIGIYTLTRKS